MPNPDLYPTKYGPLTIRAMSELCDVCIKTLYSRIRRFGINPDRAMGVPDMRRSQKGPGPAILGGLTKEQRATMEEFRRIGDLEDQLRATRSYL